MEPWSDTTPLQKVTSPENGATPPAGDKSSNHAIAYEMIDHGEVSALPPRYVPVREFPKEFNKNYFEALDRRYTAILILTLLLEPLLIWYLLRTQPMSFSDQEVASLQNRYAELFLSEFKEEPPAPASPSPAEMIWRATENIPKILENVEGLPAGEATNLPRLKPGKAKSAARGLSGENREAVRRLQNAARQRGMQVLSEKVGRIGLLGVITSGSGTISRAPVTDILEYADSTFGDIDQALAQVQELRVPRAGVDYYGTGVGYGSSTGRRGSFGNDNFGDQVYIAPREIRGQRATSSGVMPEDIVTGLAAAPQKTIERHQAFEHIASTPGLLPAEKSASGSNVLAGINGLRGRAVKGPATRDRERVREIVLAHSPAIQDCYRRQLKGNPALKGKVSVRFTVNPLGHISEVEIVKSEMAVDGVPVQLPQMEECILAKIHKWRDFGQVDESQGDVTFRQTYNFGY